ncbi:Equilibrative nucleotide transporter 3 [Dichanthelium oligosanthes]|uniref:Equilibrative nucleotide transporter 3 n=1 Tax=Dichanthelium oligosanthes TaxID=888268 RepID=A0A1E5W9Q5_9POAL|nr:Equilibrative nucleotide transporter 3 [Dichanthelium oligosanthes]
MKFCLMPGALQYKLNRLQFQFQIELYILIMETKLREYIFFPDPAHVTVIPAAGGDTRAQDTYNISTRFFPLVLNGWLFVLQPNPCEYPQFPKGHQSELSIVNDDEDTGAAKTQGKYWGIFICWLLGNGSLFGFNGMLTIEDYYVYLFPKYHPTRIITLTYQPFVLTTTAIFTYHEAKVNTRVRNLTGYVLFFLNSFGAIIVRGGGIAPFIGVCIIAAAFGIADGHVQGGMTGDLSLMCPEFVQSFFAGIAASGAITSVLRASSEGSLTVTADLAAGGIKSQPNPLAEEAPAHSERLTNKQLLQQNMDYALDIFLIYILTLSIFPGFLAEDTGSHSLGSWYVLVLIASFNVSDLIGRYLPLIEQIKLTSKKGLMIAVISRFLLIPAFYFTAKYGDQGWMIMLTSLLGLSNGHLTVCVLTEAPKGYKGPEQNALGNLLVLFLLAGIFTGAVSDWLWLIGKGW